MDGLPEVVPIGVVVVDRDLELVATHPVGPGPSGLTDQVLTAVRDPRSLEVARAVLRTGRGQRCGPFLAADPEQGAEGRPLEVTWQLLPAGIGQEQLVVGLVDAVTDGVRRQQELEWRRLESTLLQRLVGRLLEVPVSDPAAAIGQSLAELGRFLHADRAYTFSVDLEARTLTNTHEWCAPGVAPALEGLRDVPFDEIPLIAGLLAAADPVVIPSVADLGETHVSDRAHLEAQGIRSIYIVPQVVEGSTVGTVGVDYVQSEVEWGAQQLWLLRSAAQAFAQAIERNRLIAERLRLLQRSVSSADDERQRLAEQLHDDAVQFLAAAVLRLGALDADAEAVESVARPLNEAVRLLRDTIAELTHPELGAAGLATAIHQHADRILTPDGVQVTIDAVGLQQAGDAEAYVTAFRIVQESLSNVRRHARATSVLVTLRTGGRSLHGTIVDDGIGISADSPDLPGRAGHLGLRLMRERAAIRGGQVTIARGEDGVGTVVRWSVPLEATSHM